MSCQLVARVSRAAFEQSLAASWARSTAASDPDRRLWGSQDWWALVDHQSRKKDGELSFFLWWTTVGVVNNIKLTFM